MPWYGWLGWILMLCLGIGFLIYLLVRPKKSSEIQFRLNNMEDELKLAKANLELESEKRKKAEEDRSIIELKYLEETHKEAIEKLNEKEKNDYEKAKSNPKTGVDFMRDLLGVDSDTI